MKFQSKDQLINLINVAKGCCTINNFALKCKVNADYIADIIYNKKDINPTISFLKIIADNSGNRVSLQELKESCGYI